METYVNWRAVRWWRQRAVDGQNDLASASRTRRICSGLSGSIQAALADFRIDRCSLLLFAVKNESPIRAEMTWQSKQVLALLPQPHVDQTTGFGDYVVGDALDYILIGRLIDHKCWD